MSFPDGDWFVVAGRSDYIGCYRGSPGPPSLQHEKRVALPSHVRRLWRPDPVPCYLDVCVKQRNIKKGALRVHTERAFGVFRRFHSLLFTPRVVSKKALLVVNRLAAMLIGGASRRVDAQQMVGNVVLVIWERILLVRTQTIAFVAEFHIERLLKVGKNLFWREAIAKATCAANKATVRIEVVKRSVAIEIDGLFLRHTVADIRHFRKINVQIRNGWIKPFRNRRIAGRADATPTSTEHFHAVLGQCFDAVPAADRPMDDRRLDERVRPRKSFDFSFHQVEIL